jgi:ABC-type amino acid transport system permease subunit
MIFVIAYVTPIIAIVFFMYCVSIAKKLIKGQDVHNQAILNGLMFGFIIFSIIWSALLTE